MRKRILRGFLVDGAIIPGSSGSPVVQKPVALRSIKDRIAIEMSATMVLGIISESRYAWTTDFQSFAGLGLAFDAETIAETTDLFVP
jgi:hypothetical protein